MGSNTDYLDVHNTHASNNNASGVVFCSGLASAELLGCYLYGLLYGLLYCLFVALSSLKYFLRFWTHTMGSEGERR